MNRVVFFDTETSGLPLFKLPSEHPELLGFVRGVHFDAAGRDLKDFSQWNKDRIRLVQLGWNAANGITTPAAPKE